MSFEPSLFRAYDMRGTYPDQMNADVAYAAGQAFVRVMNAKAVVVGRDVRSSGVELQEAMIRGITDAGAHAINVGVISTELLYFAAATIECDGGMSITASHNPSQWNGIKFIGAKAVPLTRDGVLGDIYRAINENHTEKAGTPGTVETRDLTEAYAEYLERFTPQHLPHLKLVANVNFGANGRFVDRVTRDLPLDIVRLNWVPDGTFPKGTPDPLLPSNRKEICERIVEENAAFGVAWDADADRCFFYDEKGRFFHGYYITALLITAFLEREKGAKAIVERRLVWANTDAAEAAGGEAIYSRTGHGYIKQAMRQHGAVIGGETSGHYYYRDYFFCDSGLVTFLVVLDMFAREIAAGRTVSQLLDTYLERYPISMEELNYITPDAAKIIDAAAATYHEGTQNHEDGLTVDFPDWHFNLRMSSNEPVLRLNLEAKTPSARDARLAEMRQFIEGFGATLRDDHA